MEKKLVRSAAAKYVGLCMLVILCCFLFTKVEVQAAKFGKYNYTVNKDNTIKITKFLGKSESLVVIPSKIENKKVTIIGKEAFAFSGVKNIVIPNTVKRIEELAFFDCYRLKRITIPKSVTKITDPGLGWFTTAGGNASVTVYCPKNSRAHKVVKNTYDTHIGLKLISGKVKVQFEGNKGKVSKKTTKMVKVGKKYGALPKATRKGYKFTGWYTHKKGGVKVTKSNVEMFGYNHKLYAQWKKK